MPECKPSGGFAATVRKLIPTFVLVTIAVLAGATDVFSQQVQEFVSKSFHERIAQWTPYLFNLLIAAIVINIAWLLYNPLLSGTERLLRQSSASDRGKALAGKVLRIGYWGFIVFIVLTFFAQELMGKFFIGFSVFGAALTLAMQGAANDFICGVLMQFTQRLKTGDEIKTIGLEVEGRVIDVGYLNTTIEGSDGKISVPNRKIWEHAIKVKKGQGSKLILPPGFERDAPPPAK